MLTLCRTADHKAHLTSLIEKVNTSVLTGPQAWSAFSQPKAAFKYKGPSGRMRTLKFSKAQRDAFKWIKDAATKELMRRCGMSCSYCRRPVGNYGYGWQIEHVLPKSRREQLTFTLSNLTVACVDCNSWKGARVDKLVTGNRLPIINPLEAGFVYSTHLRYLQLGTEDLSFAKYWWISNLGKATYEKLSFDLLERAQAINSLDSGLAALHDRITRAMSVDFAAPDAAEAVAFLRDLKRAIYRRP